MNLYFAGMLISMAVYIALGFIISRSVTNANDFYVAGRNAPTLLITGSLVASYCSTGLFMGDVGEAYDGVYIPVLITIAMLITGYVLGRVFFGKYLRRSEVLTMLEFFGKRFRSRKMKILAALTGLVICLVYMLSIMQGIGTLMNYVTGVNYNPTGTENMIWALMTGFTWITVCMVGPWQSSRYLMAKNEHAVIRSSCLAAFFVFLIEFLMMTAGAFLTKFQPDMPGPSYAMIWGATHLLPTMLGVIMLTGVLAAGISSATTFLSLISSSIANDLLEILWAAPYVNTTMQNKKGCYRQYE